MPQPDFQITCRHAADDVELTFSGAFEAPAVQWQVRIMSLRRYLQLHPHFKPSCGERTALMEVASLKNSPWQALVALPFDDISSRQILQTIIMLRNYRNMEEGLRQWSA